MPAPESVKKLIETFGNNLDFYKSTQYNEAQLRQEFLDTYRWRLGCPVDGNFVVENKPHAVVINKPHNHRRAR